MRLGVHVRVKHEWPGSIPGRSTMKKKPSEQQQRMLDRMTPEKREQVLKQRKKNVRTDRLENAGLIAAFSAVGLGCLLYLLGFCAFWAGVIYLVWKLALS